MKYHLWLCILFFTNLNWAQTRDTLYLWPNKVPNEKGIKHRAVQTPDTSRNVIRITDITNPSLTVFKPKKTIQNGASIIISPGGGYGYLAVNIEGHEIAEWFNSLGYTAFVLEYRTPNNRLGALNDIQRAIRLVRSNAANMNLNPSKIGVIGFSAGGHLSLLASSNYEEDSYPKSDAIDSVSSRPDFSLLLYPAYLDRGENNTLTPEINVHKNMPPTFLFGTFDDSLVNGFLVLANSLKNIEAPLELHIVPIGGHGYGMRTEYPSGETWPKLAEDWLAETVFKLP